MRLIDMFIKKVKETTEGFCLEASGYTYLFTQVLIGSAYLVFGEDLYQLKVPHKDSKLDLAAIKTKDMVYIVDPYLFDLWRSNADNSIPDGAMLFSDKISAINQEIAEGVFKKFIDNLPIEDICEGGILNVLRDAARQFILTGSEKHLTGRTPSCSQMFKENDVIHILCGLDAEAEAMRQLEEKREDYVHMKSLNFKRNKFMASEDIVLPYEKAIADALNSVDAKTVTVEFKNDGKTASEKMEPHRVIQTMLETNGYFSDYNFCNRAAAARMFEKLGATSDRWNCSKTGKRVLTPKDITKITYGKKVLYTREDVQ